MNIVAYCRVSTDSPEQVESLEKQKTFFEGYAEREGHNLIKIYADEGISGRSKKKRKAFLQLLEDAKKNLFDEVVVKDISRFARNTVDCLEAVRFLVSLKINVRFLTNNYSVLENGEFTLTIFSALAQEESASLSKRIKFGKDVNASKGRVPTIIYGYNRIDNFTLEINEKEAEVVNRIYHDYVDKGWGSRKIAAQLIIEEVPSKKNSLWRSKTIRRILSDPIYCGFLINRKYETDYINDKRILLPVTKNITHKKPQLAIITKELFQRTQEELNKRRDIYKNTEFNKQGRYSNKHIFSTLIKCEDCGYSFIKKSYTYKNERIYWKCCGNDQYGLKICHNTFTINEKELLDEVRKYLSQCLNDKTSFIEAFKKNIIKEGIETQDILDKKILEKKLSSYLTKLEKYKTMFINGIIEIKELNAKDREFKNLISETKKQLDCWNIVHNYDPEEKMLELENKIESVLQLKTIDNMALREVIEKIIVNKNGEVKIYIKTSD